METPPSDDDRPADDDPTPSDQQPTREGGLPEDWSLDLVPAPPDVSHDIDRRTFPKVPGYELLRRIGRGGMADVYEGRPLTGSPSVVAVKIPRQPSDPNVRQRFGQEVRWASELYAASPDRLVRVIEAHPDSVIQFLVMDRAIPGCESLAELLRERTPGPRPDSWQDGRTRLLADPRLAARLVCEGAEGVAALHSRPRPLIHRDLKPSNLLLFRDSTPTGPFEWDQLTVRVCDIGLARTADTPTAAKPEETRGTWAYMAPEQLEGDAFATVCSDVYSLGVVLYEALTGTRPFSGVSPPVQLQRMKREVPERPSRQNPDARIPPALEAICLKCLDARPQRRYANAGELAADLRRFLTDNPTDPVRARLPGPLRRVGRWTGRNRLAAAVVVGLVLVSACLATVTLAAVAMADAAYQQQERQRVETLYIEREREEQKRVAEREKELRELAVKESAAANAAIRDLMKALEGAGRYQAQDRGGRDLLNQARAHLAGRAVAAEAVTGRAGEAADLYRQCGRMAFNLDDTQGAADDYTNALRLAELADTTDGTPTAKLRLAGILREWGVTRAVHGKLTDAKAAWERAFKLLTPLADTGPDYRFTLAQLHLVRANLAVGKDAKRKEYGEAQTLLDDLLTADPAHRRYRFTLAEVLNNRAHTAPDDPEQDEADCRKAVDLRRKLVKEFPESPDEKAYLAASLNHLGNALRRLPDQEKAARTAYEESQKIYEALILAFPGVRTNRTELWQVQLNLSSLKAK